MIDDLRIRQLIEARLLPWASEQDPALPVEVENIAFTPPPLGQMYLRGFQLPATTSGLFLDGKHTGFLGVYQVTIVAPKGKGAGPSGIVARGLRALFPQDLRIPDGDGSEVIVLTPLNVSPAIPDDTNYVVSTSFTYRADTTT